MLLRFITVISLIQFVLLMISGVTINIALYRSILVFLILFTVVYLAFFFMNIIQGDPQSESSPIGNNSQKTKEKSHG